MKETEGVKRETKIKRKMERKPRDSRMRGENQESESLARERDGALIDIIFCT